MSLEAPLWHDSVSLFCPGTQPVCLRQSLIRSAKGLTKLLAAAADQGIVNLGCGVAVKTLTGLRKGLFELFNSLHSNSIRLHKQGHC